MTSFVDGMAARDLPLSVFHFDCFWMREFHWCDFDLGRPRPSPTRPACSPGCKEKGLRICLWINPYIAQRSPLFAEGVEAGYLLRRPDGDVWQTDQWQAGMGIVDFTNPDARAWYADKLRALLDLGVDCFKTDFGERIPTDVVWSDGSDPERMHNYYTYLYNQCVFELLREPPGRGRGGAVRPLGHRRRSAVPGPLGRRLRVDVRRRWRRACAAACRWRRPASASGATTSAGSRARPDPAVFKRWIPFGLLSHAQPAARQRQLPGAVAVRRGVGRRAAPVHPR